MQPSVHEFHNIHLWYRYALHEYSSSVLLLYVVSAAVLYISKLCKSLYIHLWYRNALYEYSSSVLLLLPGAHLNGTRLYILA